MVAELSEPRRSLTADEAAHYVRAESVVKRFGNFTALGGISIEVREGETLALLGPSGCGKTTFLRCLAGLETPDAGCLEIGGTVVFDAKRRINLMPERRELGIVFQSYAVWPHMTVGENVGFPLKVRKVPRREVVEHVDEVLSLVGLLPWRDRSAMALSGGQQQRVALARALVHKPRLVLFDEPMSNLDAQLREQMRVELKLLQQRLGFTAIFVTHDQSEAFALARRVVVMNHGHIEAVGSPREVFNRPASAFVARFFGFNVLPGKVARADGTSAEVTLGADLKLRGCNINAAPLAPGDRVVFCVRKEHVRVAAPGAEQTVSGTLRASSFQGLQEEHVVFVGDLELRALQPVADVAAGPVMLALDPQDCLVLADSGDEQE